MYRPKDWEQTRHLDLAGTTNIVLTAGQVELYEAGADAMLEALVENGWLGETNMVDEDPEEKE